MCGGVIFADLKTPAVTRRVIQATPWPEKKKARRGGSGGLRFTGLDGFGVELRVEDDDLDSEEFKVDSRDSVLDLEHGGVAEDDDDGRSSRSIRSPSSRGPSPKGSNTFGGSDLGWEYDIKTPDISSIAPISTIAEGAESALVQSNTYNPVVIAEGVESALVQGNTYNSVVPPVMENDVVSFEAWMRFFMDDGVDEPIDSLLNFDVPQDVIGNMDLWNFDDMPICGDFF